MIYFDRVFLLLRLLHYKLSFLKSTLKCEHVALIISRFYFFFPNKWESRATPTRVKSFHNKFFKLNFFIRGNFFSSCEFIRGTKNADVCIDWHSHNINQDFFFLMESLDPPRTVCNNFLSSAAMICLTKIRLIVSNLDNMLTNMEIPSKNYFQWSK